ncbi:hypothetical protein RHMOL_Rhmol13G0072700 [Rhododendron molle]|uniref:Uncharacterized protein n=1 Tax=Rhododendron molle TaxID=49168 RepID=A0ACC0L4X3_RHOML|nr:hypothetical protein RHMOL_Rhmol13G0072700 [Rhododendron molle]
MTCNDRLSHFGAVAGRFRWPCLAAVWDFLSGRIRDAKTVEAVLIWGFKRWASWWTGPEMFERKMRISVAAEYGGGSATVAMVLDDRFLAAHDGDFGSTSKGGVSLSLWGSKMGWFPGFHRRR